MFLKKSLLLIFCFCLSPAVQAVHQKWGKTFILNHKGLNGLIKYADTHFNGNIPTAYETASSNLDEETFEKLDWKKYRSELNQLREKISFFYTGRKLNKGVLSFEAQNNYAMTYHEGNLARAYYSGKLILSDKKESTYINHLKWLNFPGTIADFNHVKRTLYDENNKLRPLYKGLSGQMRAAEHFDGLHDTFNMAKMTHPPSYFSQLNGWIKGYTGSSETLISLLKLMQEEALRLKQLNNKAESQYTDIKGQMILGRKTGILNTLTLYNNIQAIINTHSDEINYEVKSLLEHVIKRWVPFNGTAQQLSVERSYFLNENGKPHPDIITMKGLAELARKHYGGNIHLAYSTGKLIFEAYNIPLFSLLWLETKISSETFFKEWNQLYNRDDTVKNKYKYPKGLAQYAEDYHNGDMKKAYRMGKILVNQKNTIWGRRISLSEASEMGLPIGGIKTQQSIRWMQQKIRLQQEIRLQLGWGSSTSMQTSKLFWKYYSILADNKGNPRKEWEDTEAHREFARKYTKGSILKAWQTQFYIFADQPRDSDTFRWRLAYGEVDTIPEITRRFFDSKENLKEQYKKLSGYILYAQEYREGDLSKAFHDSRYLPLSIRKELNWHLFDGSIEELKRDKSIFKQYTDMKGLIQFASMSYGESIQKAYHNVLAIFEGNKKRLHKETGWFPFYADNSLYSFSFFNIKEGRVADYKRDKTALFTKAGKINPLYENMEGYIRFADKYYDGNMHMAYYNARAVFETHNLEPVIGWILFRGKTDDFKQIRNFISKHYPIETLPEITTRQVKEITNLFMREHSYLPVYKKEFENKIKEALSSYKPVQKCQRSF